MKSRLKKTELHKNEKKKVFNRMLLIVAQVSLHEQLALIVAAAEAVVERTAYLH